ncbi:MAG: cupin domain-containing protein [Rhodospirillales bacterium]|nr:cupin domain-containing protein [Rhodospirillales bacterium]
MARRASTPTSSPRKARVGRKAAPRKRAAASKTAAKKAAVGKPPARKAASGKAAARKAAVRKTAAGQASLRKTGIRKAAAPKAAVPKAPARKVATRKVAPGKATAPRKAASGSATRATRAAPTRAAPKRAAARRTGPKRAAAPRASAGTALKTPAPPQRFTVSHLHEEDFRPNGLRPYARYRDLGIAEATGGLAQAHVIRMLPPVTDAVRQRHLHNVELQLVYVLKGWMKNEFEGHGVQMMDQGSCWLQPPGIPHTVLDYSDDLEVLEIIIPAEFETKLTD